MPSLPLQMGMFLREAVWCLSLGVTVVFLLLAFPSALQRSLRQLQMLPPNP